MHSTGNSSAFLCRALKKYTYLHLVTVLRFDLLLHVQLFQLVLGGGALSRGPVMSLRGYLLFIERLGELVFGLGHGGERRPEVGVALGEGVAVPSQLLLQLLDPGGNALRVLFGEAVRQQLVLTGDETDLLKHLERTELNYLSSGK